MPLCNYYINGNCRFGSKCNNDHIDLKSLLKTEVDLVIGGKQWILSCFGPFKESRSVPNFITDQSFEEVRMQYIENSKTGNLQQYLNSLIAEYNSAVQKLNELKMPSSDALQIISSLYNESTEQKSTVSSPPMVQKTPSQNPFQPSIFSGNTGSSMSTANIFGTSAATSNPFQSQQQQPQATASIFGSTTTAPQQQQQQPSPFSSPFAAATATRDNSQGSIFTQNVFGSMATSAAAVAQTSSIFGGSTSAPPTNVFVQFGAPPNTQQQSPSSIFSSAVQQQPMATNVQQQNHQSMFSQPSFSQPLTQTPSQSIFGTTQGEAQNQNPFQQVQSVPQQPSTTNIFGAVHVPQQPTPQVTQTPSSTNIFQIQQQPAAQGPPQTFGGGGGNPFLQNVSAPQIDDSFYSQPSEISAEDNEAFQAENFAYGKIPKVPPPKSACF